MNKKNILLITGFILAIILTAIITAIIVKNTNKQESNKINEIEKENVLNNNSQETEEEETNTEEDNNTIVKDESSNNTPDTSNNQKEETKPSNNDINTNQKKTETDVINYVEEISNTSATTTLKEGFVKVIDFLFYGGEIYGKTFSELSNSAKIKIISLALKIDTKIDEYFPGYKEKISSTSNKIYTSVKTKLITLYLDTTVKICNNNPTLCEDAKAGLQDLKQSFGLTWDFIKDISGIGLTKLKDWYEVWREE